MRLPPTWLCLLAALGVPALSSAQPPLQRPVTIADSLVAAWDFSAANALADKATAGKVQDTLKLLGDTTIRNGIAVIPTTPGAGLQAASSADLELTEEMTLWARFRVMGESAENTFISLVDKRTFKPERRSYAWILAPSPQNINAWALGGQVSSNGTRTSDLRQISGPPTVPLKAWRQGAMVVRRVGKGCEINWYISNGSDKLDVKYDIANERIGDKKFNAIFRASQPLLIGATAGGNANAAVLELDEVRIYNRAFGPAELLLIKPGELSQNAGG